MMNDPDRLQRLADAGDRDAQARLDVLLRRHALVRLVDVESYVLSYGGDGKCGHGNGDGGGSNGVYAQLRGGGHGFGDGQSGGGGSGSGNGWLGHITGGGRSGVTGVTPPWVTT